MSTLEVINQEVSTELANEATQRALLATTFKGLDALRMRQAILEGRMRGFEFKDFLEKNVYAIPFREGYSLATSIDYSRKIGMRNGVVGKSAPVFEEKDGKIVSCTITVKRKVNDYIGEYTSTVYFDEYNTGKNLWVSKPRTMIAKVAEMHALRSACPEELAKAYIEEEMEKEVKELPPIDMSEYRAKLENSKTIEELASAWSALPAEAKKELEEVKNVMKSNLTQK